MASPISTAQPTPETLIPKCFTISVSNIPSSRIALSAVPAQAGQKHRRLLDLSFFPVSHLNRKNERIPRPAAKAGLRG